MKIVIEDYQGTIKMVVPEGVTVAWFHPEKEKELEVGDVVVYHSTLPDGYSERDGKPGVVRTVPRSSVGKLYFVKFDDGLSLACYREELKLASYADVFPKCVE